MKGASTSVAALVAVAASAAAGAAAPVPVGGVAGSPATAPVPPAAGVTAQPMRVVSRAPLTLRVEKRRAGERVRVVVTAQGRTFTRVLVVRSDGTATLELADVRLRRCQPVYVRLGTVGPRLQVVRWPSLDCPSTT